MNDTEHLRKKQVANEDGSDANVLFVLTGFKAFQTVQHNTTEAIANGMKQHLTKTQSRLVSRIETMAIDVSKKARDALNELCQNPNVLKAERVVFLHMGLDHDTRSFKIENQAYNWLCDPERQLEEVIVHDMEQTDMLETSFDTEALKEKMKDSFDTIVSHDAQRYYCNFIYFCSLFELARESDKYSSLFLHVPTFGTAEETCQMEYVAKLMETIDDEMNKE